MAMLISLSTNIIPHELVVEILSRLPVKSLIRFRCVHKSWKNFFNDPSFIQMHLNHSINNYEHLMLKNSYLYSIHDDNEPLLANEVKGVEIDFPFKNPRFKIWGSCNGLFLISPAIDINCIWNPSTGEFMVLAPERIEYPKIDERGFEISSIVYGFGYDKISGDYKVLRVVVFEDVDDETLYASEVKLYTLGSDSWRRVDDIPYNHAIKGVYGKHVNGALHWVVDMVRTPKNSDDDEADDDESDDDKSDDEEGLNNTDEYIMVCFNLKDEKYKEIPQPNYTKRVWDINVEALGGYLCIVSSFDPICSEIWVMKDYGVKESWRSLITINKLTVFQSFENYAKVTPIKVTKNGEVLFVIENNRCLTLLDPKHQTTKTLKISGIKGYFEAQTYVESLISLNTGNFVWQQQAEWKRTRESRKRKAKERGL